MDYSLRCDCGNRVSVSERSAGSLVSCSCGSPIAIPSLRQLQALDPGQVYEAKSFAPPGSSHSSNDQPVMASLAKPDNAESPITPEQLQADLDFLANYAVAARQAGLRNMTIGGLVCVAGIVITAVTYSAAASSGGGSYVVAWGAIIFGAIQFFRGLGQLNG